MDTPPYLMTEPELLVYVMQHNKWRIRGKNTEEAAEILCSAFAAYGGDNTWRLIGHYKEGLLDAIRQELLANPSRY